MNNAKLQETKSRLDDMDSKIQGVRDQLDELKAKRDKERLRLRDLERAQAQQRRLDIRNAFAEENGYPADGALFILIYNRAAQRCPVEHSTFLETFETEETLVDEVVAAVNGDLERPGFSK